MPIPDTSVKHIHNGMRGAPAISGTAGTLIAALDALFNTGWGVVTPLSISVADGVATATFNSGESFDLHSVVLVAGATPSALNGEARVLTSSSTSITWATDAPDGSATGSITIRYAPQTSWQKVYAATNRAVYRSTDVLSPGHYFRIDDAGAQTARVRGYESMTDVDTGVGPFPTDAMMSGGGYLWKSQNTGATAVQYRIFCDPRFVILAISAGTANGPTFFESAPFGFGDPIHLSPSGDAWCTLVSYGWNSIASPSTANLAASTDSGVSNASQIAVCRALSGLGGSVMQNPRPFVGTTGQRSGTDAMLGTMPSEVDGQIKFSRMFLRDAETNKPPRSVVPGVLYLPQTGASAVLSQGDLLAGAGELNGRVLMALCGTSGQYNQTPTARFLVDISGPWR